ncbi:EF-hand domain-containing protein [Rhizobium tumorigenes]|uniref:EF-hand domain-containing protein n=1 Tax=Rhizobium tumorigenes TaxID=2041385 RepID=A0AAF1KA60_9HYPH|nr:EF-hand domain-containing protein [Rhizobium tumorigenes]WFR95642.1 EF-hand domain-containing protein [Rhizobium tumorigenes]
MIGKKILITAMSATLLLGGAAATFAANGHHMGGRHGARVPPEVIFVRMLQQFDTNGDMKISKDEATAGADKLFDAIDTNKDGSITPGEYREYRETQMKAMWEERKKMMEDNKDKAKPDEAMNDDEGGKPPRDSKDGPRGEGRHGKGMRGGMMGEMLFKRIDTDQNGQISKAEAEAAMAKLFDRMDRNHDGFIALDDMPKMPLL